MDLLLLEQMLLINMNARAVFCCFSGIDSSTNMTNDVCSLLFVYSLAVHREEFLTDDLSTYICFMLYCILATVSQVMFMYLKKTSV